MKNSKLALKIIMFIIIIIYMILFVLFKGYNNDILQISLLFIGIITCSLGAITNSKITYVFIFSNYIIFLILFILIAIPYLPKNIISKEDTNLIPTELICTGESDISNDTKIEITYVDDDIKNLAYTYTFSKDNQDGAKNLINKFDMQYKNYNTIYSELTINNNNITVKFTYDLENIDKADLDKNLVSFKNLNDKELKKMTCKNRDN